MECQLRCTLSPGQFSSELAVCVASANSREFSLFAQKADVEYHQEPTSNNPTQGWLTVNVLECKKGLCLVRLPQTTLENGQHLTVNQSDLKGHIDDSVLRGTLQST